jgi:hypothetical protein
MGETKFGIEAEYALIRPDGRFADFTNTAYSEVQPVIDALPDHRYPELRIGDAGIRVKNWYVEGDERFDEDGQSTDLAFKGIEIRTPVFPTIEDSIRSLQELRLRLGAELNGRGWSLAAIGFNPRTTEYRPSYAPWEKQLHASHLGNALPEVSTLSYGPDLNFSRSDDSPRAVLERVRRLTYYSPYIVPFSFNSPVVGGALWEGLSYRTYKRTGPRPAALGHLIGKHDHPLVKAADPPSQHLRIEFKSFDMVGDDQLLAELFYLVLGISLADVRDLPGAADLPNPELHQEVALSGFDDGEVHSQAARIVAAAQEALEAHGWSPDLPQLEEMLATRRTPAHASRAAFAAQEPASDGGCGEKVSLLSGAVLSDLAR